MFEDEFSNVSSDSCALSMRPFALPFAFPFAMPFAFPFAFTLLAPPVFVRKDAFTASAVVRADSPSVVAVGRLVARRQSLIAYPCRFGCLLLDGRGKDFGLPGP